ncbi:MAG: hypothetical protein RCG16_05025 [Rickettsia hoogstraalii]
MMLTHHGTHGKLKLLHLEDGGLYLQRDYQNLFKEEFMPEKNIYIFKLKKLN